MSCDYKLFQELRGHDEDVRSLARVEIEADGFRVASSSRDKSVRVWRSEIGAANDCEAVVLGHEDFVTSVTYYGGGPKDTKQGSGGDTSFLATGSRDKTARIWRLRYEEAAAKDGESTSTSPGLEFSLCECAAVLRGHRYQVTAALVLERSQPEGSEPKGSFLVATASLDGVVRIWKVGADDVEREQDKPVQVISDHEGPVLCLCELEDGTLASGSGDSSIRLWKRASGSDKTFHCVGVQKEHTDTVRSLASLPGEIGYLSASHDTTVRSWGASGAAKVFMGHSALVYDVKATRTAAGTVIAASASEDCTCRVWDAESGQCMQVLEMPGCAWAVDLVPTSRSPLPLLVAGTSDGVVRVFGQSLEDGVLDENLVAAFDAAVAERKAGDSKAQDAAQGHSPQGLKVEDISALKDPGAKDGQVKTVRDTDGKTYAYQWSVISLKWECVGEVVAGPEDPASTGAGASSVVAPDKMFDGQHYDYVFDVDVQDGVPPLKLPYNRGENPYEAADRFLLAHSLPQSYREQVVQFIIQNTGGTQEPSAAVPMDVTANVDPYARTRAAAAYHVPLSDCLRFEQCKKDSMMSKIREFNEGQGQEMRMSDAHLGCLDKAVVLSLQRRPVAEEADLGVLVEALNLSLLWEKEKMFPILDALRIILLCVDSEAVMSRVIEGCPLFDIIVKAVDHPRPTAIEVTVLRLACNACVASPSFAQSLFEPLLNSMAESCKSKSKPVRLAWSTLLLNCAVLVKGKAEIDPTLLLSYTFQAASEYVDVLDMDSSFRALVGLGTLMTNDSSTRALAKDLGLDALVSKAKQLGGRMSEVSSDLQNILRSS